MYDKDYSSLIVLFKTTDGLNYSNLEPKPNYHTCVQILNLKYLSNQIVQKPNIYKIYIRET